MLENEGGPPHILIAGVGCWDCDNCQFSDNLGKYR